MTPFLRLVSLFLVFAAGQIVAADIVALVIGNNEYQREEDKLDTPVNDAQLMKRTLDEMSPDEFLRRAKELAN